MIEELGHKKDVQRMRKDWIDEGKPRNKSDDEDDNPDTTMFGQTVRDNVEQMEGVEAANAQQQEESRGGEDTAAGAKASMEDIGPDEDELDALLAEEAAPAASLETGPIPSRLAAVEDDPFADEMEAMADMEDMWN